MNDSRLIRDIEAKLRDLNLDPDEEVKRRRQMYRALGIEPQGFLSKDIELPEGAILIGVSKGELKQAIAREGQLWVDGEGFAAISGAAIKASGHPNMSGWTFWRLVYIPGSGFVEADSLRLTEQRKNSKRK